MQLIQISICCSWYKFLFVSVDTNLIQLDTDDVLATNTNATYADNDDDIIFEVRIRAHFL